MSSKSDKEMNKAYVARQWHPSLPGEVALLVGEAASFAFEAHRDQNRKGSGDPYIVHPQRVAKAVDGYVSPAAIAAAYLHDVVEDTNVKDLSMFPLRVRQLVQLLTRRPDEEKDEMIERIGKSMDTEGILIKVADRIDNLMDGTAHFNVKWLKKYARGGQLVVEQARAAGLGDHPLVKKLQQVVRNCVQYVPPKGPEHAKRP